MRYFFNWLFNALCRAPIRKLQGFQSLKSQVLTALCATHAAYTATHHYEQVYGDQSSGQELEGAARHDEPLLQLARAPIRQSIASSLISHRESRQHDLDGKSRSAYPRDHELEWRQFPDVSRWYWNAKCFSNIWMCYAVLRFFALEIYAERLNKLLKPLWNYPLHCILVGRFVVYDNFSSFLSYLFASVHLIWAANVSLRRPPYFFGALHFMLLSEHDLRLFHSRLENLSSRNPCSRLKSTQKLGFKLSSEEVNGLKPRELFLLETMCYKLVTPSGAKFVLRPSRTAESHVKLRRYVAVSFYLVYLTILVIASSIAAYSTVMVSLDSRYLHVYSMCDAHLQHLNDTGQLQKWSVTFTRHRLLTATADLLESLVLWVESGFFLLYGCLVTCFVNYDLLLQWQGIDREIKELLNQCMSEEYGDVGCIRGDNSIRGLRVQIMDFFEQVKRADPIISDALKISLFGWLYFVAAITFFVKGRSISLPSGVILILIFIVTIILTVCINFLRLHRHCNQTYQSLCSLLAHENARSRRSLSMVLEMFMLKKFCYTLLGHYPLVPTTLITTVGYSVSCFFLVSGLLQERNTATCKCSDA